MPARFALAFCRLSNSQLSHGMQLRAGDVDSASLLHAHKVLADLEGLIIQKYGTTFTASDVPIKHDITSPSNNADIGSISPTNAAKKTPLNSPTMVRCVLKKYIWCIYIYIYILTLSDSIKNI